jgi:hypothetical protein
MQPARLARQKGGRVTTVTDPKTNMLKVVERCRSCDARIYWSPF